MPKAKAAMKLVGGPRHGQIIPAPGGVQKNKAKKKAKKPPSDSPRSVARRWRANMQRGVARGHETETGEADRQGQKTADDLKYALDLHQQNRHTDSLPKNKAGLVCECERFLSQEQQEEHRQTLAHGKRGDLIDLLATALGHTPRKWLCSHGPFAGECPKRTHRFGLPFDYRGSYPLPVYRDGMTMEEMRAMLELHPEPKFSATALKTELRIRGRGGGLTGCGRPALLERLRSVFSGVGSHSAVSFVSCWADEAAGLQAGFDADEAIWREELAAALRQEPIKPAARKRKPTGAQLKPASVDSVAASKPSEVFGNKPPKPKPKRPRSAYIMYAQSVREAAAKSNLTLKMAELSRVMGTTWNGLTAEARKPFELLAADDKLRYETEFAASGKAQV